MTRVIGLLGANLPSVLLSAQPDNPRGFWESLPLMQIHEAMLASAGSSWQDISRIAPSWFASDAARGFEQKVAAVLRRDFAESPLFVVKDPRICRLVPFWLSVLNSLEVGAAFVLAVRNPLETAGSLKKRDGFPPALSLLLWLRHMLEAERDTRGQARSIVSFEQLLGSWHAVTDKIAADLGLSWPRRSHVADAEIEAFLSADGRHHTHSLEELNTRPDVADWVKRVYATFRAAAEGGGLATQTLDAVHAELDAADFVFGPVLAESQWRLAGVCGELKEVLPLVTAREADIAHLRGELTRQESESESVGQELEATKQALAAKHLEVATVRQEMDAARTALAVAGAEASALRDELEATQTALAAEHEELQATQTALAAEHEELQATQTALAAEHEALQATQTALAVEHEQLQATQTALATEREELETIQRALADSHSTAGGLKSELIAARASGELMLNSRSWRLTKPVRQLIEGLSYVGAIGLARTMSLVWKRQFVTALHFHRHLAIIKQSRMFDASWYLAQYPDVAGSNVEPVRHYLMYGAAEGRDPHPRFDTSWYLDHYPDVARTGLNPLVHYILRGAMEGRHPHPRYDGGPTQIRDEGRQLHLRGEPSEPEH